MNLCIDINISNDITIYINIIMHKFRKRLFILLSFCFSAIYICEKYVRFPQFLNSALLTGKWRPLLTITWESLQAFYLSNLTQTWKVSVINYIKCTCAEAYIRRAGKKRKQNNFLVWLIDLSRGKWRKTRDRVFKAYSQCSAWFFLLFRFQGRVCRVFIILHVCKVIKVEVYDIDIPRSYVQIRILSWWWSC